MLKKISFISILLFTYIGSTYAFDATISTTSDKINLNDYTKLRIQVELNDEKNVEIKEIKGLENFDILSNSQGSSSSSNVVIIDGKAKTETKSVNYIDLTISPKKSGNYILGPAIVTDGNITKETNSLNISVDGKKIVKSNSHLNREFEKKGDDDFIIGIILFIFLLITVLFLGIVYKFYPDLFNKYYELLKNKFNTIFSINAGNATNEKNEIEVDLSEINYPEISDLDFAEKINVILRKKLKNKYYIENIDSKSYNEIYELLPQDLADKANLKNIIDTLNKLKYSNLDLEKNEILELVKKI
ncbi:MAG: BatD family protein [Candidatus Gracilibacteria bacterium]|nr:BatD family protein [Candidatus Gracilibacteria bacterium]